MKKTGNWLITMIIKEKMLFFVLLQIFCIYSCKNNNITVINNELSIDFLIKTSALSYELLDILAEKYTNHDKDYEKLNEEKLFDPPPELIIPDPHRIYARIRTVEQGGRLADVYYFMYYKNGFYRQQIKYRNMYIYFYYQGEKENWNFIVIISEHTGEIMYYDIREFVSPIF
jgi:hypothetical protein